MTEADRQLFRQIRSRLTIIAVAVTVIAVVLVLPWVLAFASSILKPMIFLLIAALAIAAVALYLFARGTIGRGTFTRPNVRRRVYEPQYRQR